MKSFRRTNVGLSNQHLFHNVDLVVFLEGGTTSFSKTEAYAGGFTDNTADIIFWQNIFSRFKTKTKIKFRSIGSKNTIKEIAVDIIDGKITSVIVAMDNEFDDILKKRLNHPAVVYSYGYSWENDIWCETVINEVIKELAAVRIDEGALNKNFKSFVKSIKIGVFADAYLFSKGLSFFPRQNGILSMIDCTPSDLPSVKKTSLGALLASKSLNRNTLYSFGKRLGICPKRYCFGHLLADYCCQLIHHYLKNHLGLNPPCKTIIYRMGINKFFQYAFESSVSSEYYSGLFIKGQ